MRFETRDQPIVPAARGPSRTGNRGRCSLLDTARALRVGTSASRIGRRSAGKIHKVSQRFPKIPKVSQYFWKKIIFITGARKAAVCRRAATGRSPQCRDNEQPSHGRDVHPCSPKFTHIHRCSPDWEKNIYATDGHGWTQMNPDEAQIILSWEAAGAGVPMTWGWQNEAKTKPKSGVARAVNGRVGFAKHLVLRGNAEFWAGSRPKAVGRVKLQNEATDTCVRPTWGPGSGVSGLGGRAIGGMPTARAERRRPTFRPPRHAFFKLIPKVFPMDSPRFQFPPQIIMATPTKPAMIPPMINGMTTQNNHENTHLRLRPRLHPHLQHGPDRRRYHHNFMGRL
jgi:hypothetical protein